jgi:hypothetical protein
MSLNLEKIRSESQVVINDLADGSYQENLRVYLAHDETMALDQKPQYIGSRSELRNIMAMDSVDPSFNTPSSGIPAFMTIAYSNELIKAITQKLAFREIGSDYQQGDFSSTGMSFPTISYTGETATYGDYSNLGQAGVNANWENRGVYKYQINVSYGDEEVARMGAAKIDLINQKREAQARKMALMANNIFFYGMAQANDIRGLLTDSDLNATIPLPASASNPSSAKWKYKVFQEIIQDISLMFNSIVNTASNQITIGSITSTPLLLCLAPAEMTYLHTKLTDFGITVYEALKKAFPSMEIVTSEAYHLSDADSGNEVQLIIKTIDGQETVQNGFTYQFMAHRLIPATSSYTQKFSSGVSGCLLKLPLAVATATGA